MGVPGGPPDSSPLNRKGPPTHPGMAASALLTRSGGKTLIHTRFTCRVGPCRVEGVAVPKGLTWQSEQLPLWGSVRSHSAVTSGNRLPD